VKYSALLQLVTPKRQTLLLILLLLLLGSAISLANPWIAGLLTETLLNGPQTGKPDLKTILLAWLGLVAVRGLIGFCSQYYISITGERMLAGLRSRIFDHLQFLPLGYFHDRSPGDTLSLLSNEASIVSRFVTGTLVQLLPLALTFIGALVIMFVLDAQIALLAAVLMPVYYLAMKLIGRRLRPLSKSWMESYSKMFSMVDENIHMLPVIKAFVREKHEHQRFEDKNQALLTISGQQAMIGAVLGPAITFLASAGLLLLLWLGISHVESGLLETGQLVSLLLYAMLLTQPISGLANVYGQVQRTRGAAERLQDFFAEQPEPQTEDKPELPAIKGDIRFDEVSFSYPGREPLFEDFGLRIAAGETLAITGPNGAGKSTLAWLLMRFAEPGAGRILIDGQDISDFSLQSLRSQIGLVAQNTLLVNGTVRDNLAYGNAGASEEEIQKAANAARASDFIEQLPQGYDTVIGDQGIKLSGGQRQRLSLARTLVKNPPILILDEATSMFDPEGEAGFIRECREVLASRTVILIGHRPTSLALANRVINLERRDSGPAFVNRSVGSG
jgi:ABC-type multidrug transport system fused ATPase/permease subunit